MPYYMNEEKELGYFKSDEEAEARIGSSEEVCTEDMADWILDTLYFDEGGINYDLLKEYCQDPCAYVENQMEEVLGYKLVENPYKQAWQFYDEIAEEITRILLKTDIVQYALVPSR